MHDVPSAAITSDYKAVGGGYYAMVEQHTEDQANAKMHLYRLIDGRHWQVPVPSDLLPSSVVWLDSKQLLFQVTTLFGISYGLMRQDIAQLGEGD